MSVHSGSKATDKGWHENCNVLGVKTIHGQLVASLTPSTDDRDLLRIINFFDLHYLNRLPEDSSGNAELLGSECRDSQEQVDRYLQSLGCPVSFDASGRADAETRTRIVEWITAQSVSIAYRRTSHRYQSIANGNNKEWDEKLATQAQAFADALQVKDSPARQSLENLARSLGLPIHDDPLVLVSAILELAVADTSVVNPATDRCADRTIDLSTFPLGLPGSTDNVALCGKVLRLLHIRHLRMLQDGITDILADLQTHTGHGEINTKLKKIGRG
eukprot:Clim_evm2s168 gene=Clim_evmTU2s168